MNKKTESLIMIVDDDPAFLNSVELLFFRMGLRNVITVSDGRDVMQSVREHNPSLILLDLELPHIHGLELLDRIR